MSTDIQPDPTVIGAVSTPPFAVVPDPSSLFPVRARRLRAYAAVSPARPYLDFVAGIVDAQAETVALAPAPAPIPAEQVARASEFGMPPLDRSTLADDPAFMPTLDALFDAVARRPMPEPAAAALSRLRQADAGARAEIAGNVLAHAIPMEALAEHAFLAAGLEVLAARLAATLDAKALKPVGETAICPACGGPPVASLVVEWPTAHGNRFCACELCGTLWNYVRIKCVSCGSTKGIGYQEVEGGPGTVKAETCDECRTYVKVLHQHKDPSMEALADDIGSLPLDMMMREGPYRRAAYNPFLIGY
ncbi:formate dehydrogenase accessory protein FdhE [Ancylobacter defluvii]|uniref:Protein FdhE homolog n=1 Tax=Ancylobacter defluvii TaxID=1282440 RepID=A0A9W6K2A1_9HYPH|nr:formate dehydrogenase accessory protein FdhE [Ancylobacter defluvii]MBS7588823.1 formate dehydrogenase accessory protein FdhE [Ancylobacter defluvii]GLK86913.1 protein FdhE [Ancylobacter defluvii]